MKKKFIGYDIFKLIVAILLVLLLLFVFRSCSVVTPTISTSGDGLVEGVTAIEGTGSKNATMGLFVNESKSNSFDSDKEGFWMTEAELMAGDNALQAVQFNKKGEVIAESEVITLHADYATVTPSFADFPEGDVVEGVKTLSGVGTPMAAMGLLMDGAMDSVVNADVDGKWNTDVDLSVGEHTLQMVELDDNGDIVVASDEKSVNVIFAPVEPSINLSEGDLNAGMNTFAGLGTPLSAMGLMVNGELVSEFEADENGNWTTDVELGVGTNDIQVVELDADGNVIGESEVFSKNTVYATVTPSLSMPENGFVEGVNTLSGMGTPMAAMGVLLNGELISEFTTDENGMWSTDVTLPAGEGELQIVEFDADGNIVAESDVYALAADYKTVTPTISLPSGQLSEGKNSFSGTGTPNSTMGLMLNGVLVAEFTTDENGNWSTDVDLSEGDADVQVVQYDADGNVIAESETASMSVGKAPVIDSAPDTKNCGIGKVNNGLYVVNYCQNLTRIAEALNVDLDALLEANPEIKDPNLIFPGQRLVIPENE